VSWLSRLNNFFSHRDSVNPTHPRDPALAVMFGGGYGSSNVTPDSALTVTALYASVARIAEDMASLPLHVYRRDGDTPGAKAKDHPLYTLLHDKPSRNMTSFEWREMMISHTALRGDSYSQIVMRNDGRVSELIPLHPDRVWPELSESGSVRYRYYEPGKQVRILLDDEVLRFPYKLLDGVHSLSPIAVHRETIGSAQAGKKFLATMLQNNASPKGGLKAPTSLSQDAVSALRKSWEERHKGPENAGNIAIFDGGLEWVQIGMSMQDAQYIELMNFSVADIARIFLMPPHKIGDLSRATFTNIEQQAIEYVVGVLNSWRGRLEGRMNNYLLSEADRKAGYYIGFDFKGLLRGDAAARANFYKTMFYLAAMNPNEIRAAEDMNPYEGGDQFWVQGATIPADMASQQDLPPNGEEPAPQPKVKTNGTGATVS